MSSNDNTTPGNSSKETTEELATTEISKDVGSKIDAPPGQSPSSNSSGSNAESLSAYAERTVATFVQRDNMSSESPPDCAVQAEPETAAGVPQKESESDPVEINLPLTSNTLRETNSEEEDQIGASGHVVQDLYTTDTSEFEDLLDGSRVSSPTLQGVGNTFITIPSSSQGEEIEEKGERSGDNDLLDTQPSTSGATATPRQLSITGRAALRKCFTENNLINFPVSQLFIALSEGQMHTVLRTISDESLLSSFHLMKSLLLQAADGKVITKERCRHVRRAGTPGPGQQSSSEGESSEGDCTSGSYTSGAINSDDDPGSLDFLVEHDRPPLSPSFRPRPQQVKTATTMMPTSPGSGYSAED